MTMKDQSKDLISRYIELKRREYQNISNAKARKFGVIGLNRHRLTHTETRYVQACEELIYKGNTTMALCSKRWPGFKLTHAWCAENNVHESEVHEISAQASKRIDALWQTHSTTLSTILNHEKRKSTNPEG